MDPRSYGLFQLHSFVLWVLLMTLFCIQAFWFPLLPEHAGPWISHHFWYMLAIAFSALGFTHQLSKENIAPLRWSMANVLKMTSLQIMLLGFFFAILALAMGEVPFGWSFLIRYYISSLFLLFIANAFLPRFLARFCYKGGYVDLCVLVGSPILANQLLSWAEVESQYGRIVIGCVDKKQESDSISAIPLLGDLEALPNLISLYGIHQIVLLEPMSQVAISNLKSLCGKKGIRFYLYNYWQSCFTEPLVLLTEAGQPFFALKKEPLENPFCRTLKRTFDILFSLPVVLFLIPVLSIVVAFFHKMQSPGPLFFKQKRRGLSGKVFYLYKFRSMHEDVLSKTSSNSSRIFSFGKFLRSTSLDEVPQFINVLLGDMSIVGPRPHWIDEEALFESYSNNYNERYWIKPGITGLAQTMGLRGIADTPDKIRQRVSLDLYYITNWSFFNDLEIVLRTAYQMIFPPVSAR